MMRRSAPLALLAATLLGHAAFGQDRAAPPKQDLPPYVTPPEKAVAVPASAAISTDGLRAAWPSTDGKSIFTSTRAARTADWSAATRLLTTRGLVHKIVFSPDGASIAYENQRTWKDNGAPDDSWQFICVYDFTTGRISHVDPSFDIDSDPVWAGDKVTFSRHVEGLPDKRLTRPVLRLKMADWVPPPKRASERFTMASVIAAPFIYPPARSGDGMALAYITREAKARNVYFQRLGEEARKIAGYPLDDGIDMSTPPALSKTGAAVAYSRGGRVNRQGDAANPNAFTVKPQQQVWILGSSDDAPRLLGPGTDPLFTPGDDFILWRRGDTVMGAALTWSNGRLLGVGSPEEFLAGRRAGLTFSPDGSKVAYEQRDGVEIYDFKSKTAVVVPHGADVDAGPVWSPDGKQIAFRRESASSPGLIRNSCGRTRYCGPVQADQPWAIWVADVNGGNVRKVWQAKPGEGSVFYAMDQSYTPGSGGAQMFWSADQRNIAFSWEGDGWRHLYSVPVSGGEAKLLTPGDGEVEMADISADGTEIIYATNIGDLDRRHITAVTFDGKSRAVTSGTRSQWSPVPLAGGKLAYIDAGWADTPTVRVQDAAGQESIATFPKVPEGFPAKLVVEPQNVSFPASDGQTAFGNLFVPEKQKGCAIVFSHGGIRRQMLPGFHYMDAYHYLYAMNQYLAGRGCVVLSVEYRSSIMRGQKFRNAPGWGLSENSELLDFVGAVTYLKGRKDLDVRKGIGVYGLSWGGYMTAQLLARHSDIYKVGFDMAGVHAADDPQGASRSALNFLDTWTSPIFLSQGDDDMNVDFNEGTKLARALQVRKPKLGFKQQVLPGQTHDLYLTYEQLVEHYTDGSDWLLSHLGAR